MNDDRAGAVPCTTTGELLIYVHIPKTAGTTLTHIIYDNYKKTVLYDAETHGVLPDGVLAVRHDLETADALAGHMWFGAHRYLPRPCTYMTMLRDPVEQVISWFYFRYRNPTYKRYPKGFDDYLQDCAFELEHSDVQTRFVCGQHPATLERAIRNVNEHFAVVGIAEQFADSARLMKQTFGWKVASHRPENINHARPLVSELSNQTLRLIQSNNAQDIALYRYAQQRLHNQLSETPNVHP